jgi:N-acetyl-alpha-D-muramate 1-phosphate uridylyltransferase
MTYPVAILAGGLATRLRPVTETIPKALIEIAGRPFIFHQLDLLKSRGVKQVVLCVGYLGEQIQNALSLADYRGLDIRYAFDGPVLLGTGGALRAALQSLGDRFFVLYGDSYLPCDMNAIQTFFENSRKPALMTVFRNHDRWDKSNVLYKAGVIEVYDKRRPSNEMQHIDYGLGILSSECFDRYPLGQAFDLADLYNTLSVEGQLAGYEVNMRFYEIGSREGIEETESFLLGRLINDVQ